MSEWQWLTTLSDAPSAQSLAQLLAEEGIRARIVSEAHLLGQAAPCRLFVDAGQAREAHWVLSQRRLSEQELLWLATGESGEAP